MFSQIKSNFIQNEDNKNEITIYKTSQLPFLKENRQCYTQEFCEIDSITNDLIKLKNGSFVQILEIEGANFKGLKLIEQNDILNEFGRLLNSGPASAQLKVISRSSDLRPYIKNLNKLLEENNEPKTSLSLIKEIKYQIEELILHRALEHHYYFIFSYKPNLEFGKNADLDAISRIQMYSSKIKSCLCKHGIDIKFHNQGEETTKFLESVLYDFYNRNLIYNGDLDYRLSQINKDNENLLNPKEKIKESNVIAPLNISFKNKDYIIINGLYYSYFIVYDFPESGVDSGWLNNFTNCGEGFDFDIIYERRRKRDIHKKIKWKNIFNKANVDQMNKVSDNFDEAKKVIRTNEALMENLEGDTEFFDFIVICTIISNSYSELNRKKQWLIEHIESFNYKIRYPKYEMEEAFKFTEPIARRPNYFFNKYHRNCLTQSLVNFYPYTTAKMNQLDGVCIGVNYDNSSPVIIDIFNPISNIIILGATGFGKSFLSMLLLTRLRLMQTQVFVLTPIKGHEYKKICDELSGAFIELGPGSKKCINILDVTPVYKIDIVDDNETYFVENSYLNEKIDVLIKFFTLISGGNLDLKTKDLLSPFLTEFYKKYGITDDNNSIYKDTNDKTILKEMPTLSDLESELKKSEYKVLRKLAIPLKKFTVGNLKYFNSQTNVDLNNKFCVLDLSKAIDFDDTRILVNFIVQNFIWSRVRCDRKHRKVIFYEELWKFLDNKETAETIREIFKTIRGYYGCAIAASQNIGDLTDNPFNISDSILNNCLIQIIFHCNSDETLKIKERFSLNDSDYSTITGLQKGEALLITVKQHFKTKVLATETERRLFETDGNKLK